jgi:hypothetical protein
MKNLSIIFIVGVVIFAGVRLLKLSDSSVIENGNSGIPESVYDVAQANNPKPNNTNKKATDLVEREPEFAEPSATDHQRELVDYSEDWCQYGQLSERDQAYAEAELKDWEASIGRFAFNVQAETGYQAYDNSYYLSEPYLEISKGDLIAHIDNEDPMAMFAALDRLDFRLYEQVKIAKELLVLGYTGKAIQQLVSYEMTQASVKYDINSGVITDTIKQHLKQAVTYAVYSLRNYDTIGFIQLINAFETDSKFEDHLNPALVLSPNDIETIANDAQQLSEWVKSIRVEKGLPAFDRELIKIAKHELDRDVGMLYGKQPTMMKIFSESFGNRLPQLATNDCRMKHSEVFARLN